MNKLAIILVLISVIALSASISDKCMRTMKEGMLKQTNVYRKRHHVAECTLLADAGDVAQKWSENLAKTAMFYHNANRNGYGENLAMGCGSANNNDYNFDDPNKDCTSKMKKLLTR
jgi:uncharacterized protein YkwD